jgi:hypothetical protein
LPLSEHIFGRWLFSHEDGGARVYRPRDSLFAPSRRPRDGFDIDEDGTFRAYTPGAADAAVAADGRWTRASGDRLELSFDDGRTRVLEIVDAVPGTLTIRGWPVRGG